MQTRILTKQLESYTVLPSPKKLLLETTRSHSCLFEVGLYLL